MKIGFVMDLVLDKTDLAINTARPIIEAGHELCIELHELHEHLNKLDQQKKQKKIIEDQLGKTTFSLHAPFEPKEQYDLFSSDKTLYDEWLRFANSMDIEYVNVHLHWDEGIEEKYWTDMKEKPKEHYLDQVVERLKPLVEKAEKYDIKLSLEALSSAFFMQKLNEYRINFLCAFPEDHNYIKKKLGYEIGINPDTCHIGMTWQLAQNGSTLGYYDDELDIVRSLSLLDFALWWITQCSPIHQVHMADFQGFSETDGHALPFGRGSFGLEGMKKINAVIPTNALHILEINESWKQRDQIEKLGFLPNTLYAIKEYLETISGENKVSGTL